MTEAYDSSQRTAELRSAAAALPSLSLVEMADLPITDIDGIPKESDRDLYEEKLFEGIDFRYQACPFSNSPSRFPNGAPHEIPISGLERDRLSENYYEILGNLQVVRDYYIDNTRPESEKNKPLSIVEMRDILMTLNYAANYLVYRSANPVDAFGKLPTDLLVMSNVAAGSLAALSVQMIVLKNEGKDSIDAVPDPKVMVEESEKMGKMVGGKTVCAASPELMVHFFKAVVDGPRKIEEGSLSKYIDKSELPQLFAYGKAMYEGAGSVASLREVDRSILILLDAKYREKDWVNFNEISADYMMHAFKEIALILHDQAVANQALGRRVEESSKVPFDEIIHNLDLKGAITVRNLLDARKKSPPKTQNVTNPKNSDRQRASARRKKYLK